MPIYGTLDTMPLCDLMQWIGTAARSGVLTVSVELRELYLFFQNGKLVALGSEEPLQQDLGRALLGRGLISEEQLAQAVRLAQAGSPLAEALASSAALDREVIARVQTEQVLERIMDLFLHNEGSFHFASYNASPAQLPPPDVSQAEFLKTPIDVQQLVLESIQRLDEWRRIQEVFPNPYVVVHALEGESENPAWRELRRIGQPVSVGELCLRLGGDRFGAFQKLYQAYQLGLIGLDLMPVGQAGQAHLGPVEVLLENARLLAAEQQFDEARAVLSTAANLEPENQRIRQLLQKLRAEQIEHLYQQLPPHRVPFLAVPRERLAELGLSPRETYLASRLNGRWDVATLAAATPLGELETLRALSKFLHAGIIGFQD